MGLELPGFVTEPLGWIGMTWPEADEDKLFEAGQVWMNYGSQLRGQAQQASATAQQVRSEHQGDAVDAFGAWWDKADGPGPNLPDNATAAELIGAALVAMAAVTLALKIAYIAQLIILAIEVAQAIATAFVTFGATTAEIPGFIAATRAICRAALNRVISVVEREIAKLFSQAAKLFEKVGAKNLAKRTEGLATKFGNKSYFHSLLSKADTADVRSPVDGANFYSGRDANGRGMRNYAEDATDGVNSTTLEQTPGGRAMDDLKLYNDGPLSNEQNDKIWGRLSENYGRNAKGDVTAYVHNPREGAIWTDKELPALQGNKNVTGITQIDPTTGERVVLKGPG